MNDAKDTRKNIIHEIFHTLGVDKDRAKKGIGKYPPQKPNQADINDLINGGFLPTTEKKK